MRPETETSINAGRLKHLEMIQQIVTRMATTSFLIKGWSVTLLSAILALAAKDKLYEIGWVAFASIFAFWLLDGFFLSQERLFRKLYDHYRVQVQTTQTDFSMDTSSLSADARQNTSWLSSMVSRTLLVFNCTLLLLLAIIIWISRH